MKPGGPIFY